MARFTGGWIKLHRSLEEKEIVDNPFLFSLWIYLLLIANYKESKIIWKGEQKILSPGQCLIKLRELSTRWKCSPTTIWKWLHFLEKSKRITVESRTHGTIVTICNWKEYQLLEQDERTPSEHQVNTERTPSEHQVDYSEEGVPPKKERRKEGKKIKVGILTDYPQLFIDLWGAYKKVGDKKRAFHCFEKLQLDQTQIETLHQAIKNYYARKEDWKAPQHFSTFLNGDWRQHLEPVVLESLPRGNGIRPLTKDQTIHKANDDLIARRLADMGGNSNESKPS